MSICTCELDFGPVDFYRRAIGTVVKPWGLYKSLYLRLALASAVAVPAGPVAHAIERLGGNPEKLQQLAGRYSLKALGVGNPSMEAKLRQLAACARHGGLLLNDYDEVVRRLNEVTPD